MSANVIERYQKKLNSLQNLPTLPVIATEIMRVMRNDSYSVSQIQRVIEKDPPLAMKVLKVANSAYYGMKNPVKSLRHALVLIGMRQLSNIAISFSILKKFDDQSSDMEWEKFWEHCIAVGFVTELMVEDYGIITRENPYTVGLLHDIGKLILNILEPGKYSGVYQEVKKSKRSFYEIENEQLNITHCDVGKMLAEKWKMSTILTDIVENHHRIDNAGDESKLIVAVLEVADHVCNISGLSFGTDFDIDNLPEPASWSVLQKSVSDLNKKSYEEFLSEIEGQVSSISEMVEIIQI